VAQQTYVKQKLALLNRQEGCCAVCAILFVTAEEVHIHHIIPRQAGGMDDLANLQAVHPWCHQQHHQRHGYKVLKA
jgi:RNA-directed DNA polymerase